MEVCKSKLRPPYPPNGANAQLHKSKQLVYFKNDIILPKGQESSKIEIKFRFELQDTEETLIF